MRGAFIKKHGYHRCARMGLFTDCLLLLRCLPLGFDAPSAQRIGTLSTDTMRGAFIKKHETRRSPTDRRGGNITDAHGWVFSRIVYSCSAAYCLGFDAPPAQRIATDFSHAENLSMRARFNGHALLYSN